MAAERKKYILEYIFKNTLQQFNKNVADIEFTFGVEVVEATSTYGSCLKL